LSPTDKILIVDVDAHHGNGNAYTFMENSNVTILDVYNNDIYPQLPAPKARVNIGVPLHSGTTGAHYLNALRNALNQLQGTLRVLSIPMVVLGGGGYSKDGAKAMSKSIAEVYNS